MEYGCSFKQEKEVDDEIIKNNTIPEAVVRNLLRCYDHINSMSEKELIKRLKTFQLNVDGSDLVLRERLKNSYKKLLLASVNISVSNELLPYYIIIDFEATCEEINPPNYRHEIIEFPAVLVSSKKQKIIDCFQMYSKPEINPKITEFCTELTGITQNQVDAAETFDKVLEKFQSWLAKHQLGKKHKYAIVTDGPLDMSKFLFSQCNYSEVKFPKWGKNWVNLKKAFSKFYKCERFSLKHMLDYLGMEFIGRPHCGLDDAKNIARILLQMIYDGANIQINERIAASKKPINRMKINQKEQQIFQENEQQEINKKNEKLRVEAHYAPIYYVDQMPIFKAVKRERLIAEAQLARKIFNNLNSFEEVNSKRNTSEKLIKTLHLS